MRKLFPVVIKLQKKCMQPSYMLTMLSKQRKLYNLPKLALDLELHARELDSSNNQRLCYPKLNARAISLKGTTFLSCTHYLT